MPSTILRRLALPILSLALAASAGAQSLTRADSLELAALARDLDDRWNARDAAGMARLFTADADLEVTGDGAARRIRGTIARDYTASFARADRTLRHRTVVDELHVVAPGVVLADGRAWIERIAADSSRTPLRAYTTRNVAVRTPEGWRLRIVRSHAEPLDAPVMRGS